MTAPIVTRTHPIASVTPLFGYRHPLPIASRTPRAASKRKPNNLGTATPIVSDRVSATASVEAMNLIDLWGRLLESLPQGVILVTRNLKPVYWNQKARKLCQGLAGQRFTEDALPLAVSEACYSVLRDGHVMTASIMIECQTSTGHLIRVSAQMLDVAKPTATPDPVVAAAKTEDAGAFIAVFLENCDEVLQQEAWIQQQKYDLTDRETEIWMLLQQEFTYQDIAQSLQISLNTVKTHVKNVYAKRRTSQIKEKFWC